MLDDCIIRAPETIQDKFFFSVLMESGLMLSGRAAREYSGAHFKFQRKPERQPQGKRDSKTKIANRPSKFQADSYNSHLF